jgi:glycogen debranching enzyme
MSEIIEIKGQYYILTSSSMADFATRVLKQGDTFGIFDRHGDIRPLGFESQGLFHEGTRFLSRLKLEIHSRSPLLLSSNVREDNDFLVADLTNPDLTLEDGSIIPRGTIHLVRTLFLWKSRYVERLRISNFSLLPVRFPLSLSFEADFVDLFQLRGMNRKHHGQLLPAECGQRDIKLRYEGLDGVVRLTHFQFDREATEATAGQAVFHMDLAPAAQASLDYCVDCRVGEGPRQRADLEDIQHELQRAYQTYRSGLTSFETSNEQFNKWIHQSRADLHMLLTRTEHGVYPYAGIPWFSCVFGRDGIITALETLWIYPEIARGVLTYLAKTQAVESSDAQDADPGKIVHEERKGEMAALGEIPFGRYYGAHDTTPLFILLAGRYYVRTADRALMEQLWPHIEQALHWIDHHGDLDGDGFIEYRRRTTGGLSNQGWKDSEDSIFHADGNLAEAPIALCEIQGYVYEARLQAARLAEILGFRSRAQELHQSAKNLKKQFLDRFWCEDLGCYALALDGQKRPCKVRSSNAGQCLFSGIAAKKHALRIKEHLTLPDFFSGWGIRTIPASAARFNPMSYHNGSIWPHDNALIAHGFASYGFKQAASDVLTALFDASLFMDLGRLPELYCGFARRPGEGPTLYPVACNPQAWASAAVFFLIQSCLGLHIQAESQRVHFTNPVLPPSLQTVHIQNLKVGTGTVDISLQRQADDVAVHVRRRVGRINVIVTH